MSTNIFRNIWRINSNRIINHAHNRPSAQVRTVFSRKKVKLKWATWRSSSVGYSSLLLSCGFLLLLHGSELWQIPTTSRLHQSTSQKNGFQLGDDQDLVGDFNYEPKDCDHPAGEQASNTESSWANFVANFATFSTIAELEWASITDTVARMLLPEWAKSLPEHMRKLRKELSMAPGSLANEIWRDARNPDINPEIEYSCSVRVSKDLCEQEKDFLAQRRRFVRVALASYLNIPLEEINPDDVPTIAIIGSGGGLRALVAGAGSMNATEKDGLLDCVTYTAGVSGSCWLQALFNSSLGNQSFEKVIAHIKSRACIHIAYPPVALKALNTAPTNKYLLSGFIEKLRSDPNSDLGLVDIYGLLLGARLLVPKGELAVNEIDLKISNQRKYIEQGQYPMPIYTLVRHHIPISKDSKESGIIDGIPSEKDKTMAKKETRFQWFEISPFEMFCEELSAGIPTWAIGRRFKQGKDLPIAEDGLYVPELRLPFLFGIFGSAFCATLAHYYREIRPLFKSLAGFASLDEIIEGRNEDLSKFHPIDPAHIPNFVYKMDDKLLETATHEISNLKNLQLMDAGMSNNLPVYPLLRPGRDVEILIAFDSSADIKTENWLSVVDGYAQQRGIKGWPVGAGWPMSDDSPEKTVNKLDEAQAKKISEAEENLHTAQSLPNNETSNDSHKDNNKDLGHCTIWVGRTMERSTLDNQVKSKAVQEDWELMKPDSGIAVIYFPFIRNTSVKNVDPEINDYMSTWNFMYSPEEVDNVVALAKSNFEKGKDKTRRCVRAVYERKKKKRELRELEEKNRRRRRKVRLGIVGKKGEGDHFYLT
ncbi:Cytosolic phospholipase A2 zeta [Erysiphe neolycopersici]|uniref:Lysophospholipase n=1 Tax=Erysiphe neolycopersici TaxID=212602 RepID=A0A420HED3_9PEZI|nr:Cytosolic phospholipase A2 zeta [Erysiphe neolycopersici]